MRWISCACVLKRPPAVYISHLDLMQTMQRAFSRTGYELKYSEGFNPHPQISIALPLSVGAASFCEIMDFKLKGEAYISDIPPASPPPCLRGWR